VLDLVGIAIELGWTLRRQTLLTGEHLYYIASPAGDVYLNGMPASKERTPAGWKAGLFDPDGRTSANAAWLDLPPSLEALLICSGWTKAT